MLLLKSLEAFAAGGNRWCYVHPEDAAQCVKIRRPDFTVAQRRASKGFPKNLKPLSSFDDNLDEYKVMQGFTRHYDDDIFAHVSRCYGYVETDMGAGLCSELVRDSSGDVSVSLKEYLWEGGYTDTCREAVKQLCRHWLRYSLPSRDLILHNVVVQQEFAEDGAALIRRLVVIDGMGSSGIVPAHWLPKCYQAAKARRKVENLHQRIAELLADREQGKGPGMHGFLFHKGRDESS
ncbi:MAG: YrbL family protein [Spongiibacteraceae bacterium]